MNHFAVVLSLLWVLILTACGGGGGSGSEAVPSPQPPPGPSSGVLETFYLRGTAMVDVGNYCARLGVVSLPGGEDLCAAVNDATRIGLDGAPLSRPRLFDPGRTNGVAVAQGSRTAGVSILDLERIVVGTIEAIDAAHARIRILGQRIYVTHATNIDGASELDALKVNERVSVSGYFGPSGDLIATAILREPSGNAFLLRGILQLDPGGNVQVGGQPFGDLSSIAAVDFPSAPTNGDAVLITGTTSGVTPTAASMRYIGGPWPEGREDVRILTGMVSRRSHSSDLEIEGREVNCTLYPCSQLSNAGVGALVGITRIDNVREAAAFPAVPSAIAVSGTVDSIDAANDSFTVLGFAVQGVPATLSTDDSGAPSEVADILRVGDDVTVRGDPVGSVIIAGSIATHSGEATVSFGGGSRFVSSDDTVITVLGQPVLIDATTEFERSSTCPSATPAVSSFFTAVVITLSPTATGTLLARHVKLSYRRRPCEF